MPVKFIRIRMYADMEDVYGMSNDPAIICLSDDLWADEDDVRWGLTYWFGTKWPTPMKWESVEPYYDPAWFLVEEAKDDKEL